MINLLFKHKQIIKYLIAGGLAASVDLGLLYFFTSLLGVWYLISACLAFIAAFFVSFSLQKFWTFRDPNKERMYNQMMVYLVVALINLVINAILIYLLVDGFKIWYMFAQLIVSGLIACESYLIYKFVIFHKNKFQGGKIKVLIATGIYPPDVGGPATMLGPLADSLTKLDFEIRVITYAERTEPGPIYRISRRQNKVSRFVSYFWHLWRLSRWADILYVTDTYSVGFFAYFIKKISGKKYIIRFAGDSAWEAAAGAGLVKDYIVDFQKIKYGRRIEKLKARRGKILKQADAIIAVSNFMAGLAEMIGAAKEKISVIYNAVDFFSAPPEYQAPAEPILVYSGRLVAWKGLATLIRAVKELKKDRPGLILKILGDGPEEAGLKKLAAELGLEKNIIFYGPVKEEKSHEIFAQSTIFVLNTNYEGLPHSVLNAMRSGLPVITTPVGGNREVVVDGRNGLLAPYDDLGAWVAAIKKLLADENLRQEFTRNGLETVKKFRWSEVIEKTSALIKKLVKNNYD